MSTLSFYTKSVNSTHPVASHSFKRIFELCFKLPERSTQCANSLNAAFTCAKYCKRVSAHHTHTHTQTEREPLPIPCIIRFFHLFQAINRTHLTSNIKERIFSFFFLSLNTIYIIWFDLCIQRFILCRCMHTLYTRSDFTLSVVLISDI